MSRMLNLAACLTLVSAGLNLRHEGLFYEAMFNEWMTEHKITPTNAAELVHFLENFSRNHDIIESHNSMNHTYTLGHNRFSHLSSEEFKSYVHLGIAKPQIPADFFHEEPKDIGSIPASIDWRSKNSVTPAKDQGQCGSCWAFSATGALEGAYSIKYGKLVSFSEQHLVDCDGVDSACNGGLMDHAFAWTKRNGGICAEDAYPYVSGSTLKQGTCNEKSCTKDPKVAPKSFTDVTPNSDNALLSAIAQQPVSVAIQADEITFQLYKSGVFTAKCGSQLDHGVLAVGYGTENGNDYYIVKNSWGDVWGESGYIRLGRGSAYPKEGQCGILSQPSYPNL